MPPDPTNGTPLRVIRLEALDFKRLRALEIVPGHKCLVVIKGPNEAGKTSAIDALVAALAGTRRAPEQPVRTGAESSTVRVTLGTDGPQYIVTRSFKGDRSSLTLKAVTPDGEARLSAAQGFLDALVADISFNPLAFAAAKPADQIRMLFGAIGATAAYDAAQARRRAAYDARTEINREVTALAAKLKASPDPAPDRVLAETPDADFAQRLAEAQAHNNRRQSLGLLIDQRAARIAALEDELAALREANARDQAAHAAMPAAVDTAQITAAIARNREANEAARRQGVARRTAAELAERQKAAETRTAEMEAIDAELRRVIEASNIGKTVPGLAVTAAGDILHNGVPFSQASGMRRLEVSCLVGMAGNPKLRVMTVDEGDRLDPTAIGRLEQLAEQHNFQVWMTAVYAGEEDDHTHVCQLADGAAVDVPQAAEGAEASRGGNGQPAPLVAAVSGPDFPI